MPYVRAVHVVRIWPCVNMNMLVNDRILCTVLLDTNVEQKIQISL